MKTGQVVYSRPGPDTLPPTSRPSIYDGINILGQDWAMVVKVDTVTFDGQSGGQIKDTRRQKCTFCGSRCEDIRGNCGACGAPIE